MKMNISAMPTECTLYLTDVCNFNCSGCRRQTIEKPIHKEIDLELVQRIPGVSFVRGFLYCRLWRTDTCKALSGSS